MKAPLLSYDLGGTKVAIGVVSQQGKILFHEKYPARLNEGPTGLLDQLVEIAKTPLKKYPSIKKVGLASAGPLDSKKGLLLDPTNFCSTNEKWKSFPIARELKKRIKREVFLENDAACAAFAEKWRGSARRAKNFIVLTLGTGLGVGIVVENKILECRPGLHPEAGHLPLRPGDSSAPCGCGNFGCAESFLSGVNFAKRFSTKINQKIPAEEIIKRAKTGDLAAIQAFSEYAELFSYYIYGLAVTFGPEVIILAGSFAGGASCFLPDAEQKITQLLKRRRERFDLLPLIKISTLNNTSGLLGAAFVALRRKI